MAKGKSLTALKRLQKEANGESVAVRITGHVEGPGGLLTGNVLMPHDEAERLVKLRRAEYIFDDATDESGGEATNTTTTAD